MSWRKLMEDKNSWTKKDMAVDFFWNTFAISPRVIALAFFASYQPYWFGGLIVAHILVSMIVNCLILRKSSLFNNESDIMDFLFMNLLSSIGMVVNMFFCQLSVDFLVFLLYWCLMFIENIIIISLWYQWSADFGLFFHEMALMFVIVAYVLSLIIKCAHCYFYRSNVRQTNILKWKFFTKYETEDSSELEMENKQNNAESSGGL